MKPGFGRTLTRALAALVPLVAFVVIAAAAAGEFEPAPHTHTAAYWHRLRLLRAAQATYGRCSDPSQKGALHVTGNELLTSKNKIFTYYGINVFGGLEDGGSDSRWEAGEASAVAQIKAAVFWHANTVRLQVDEGNLFINGSPRDGVNQPFLNAICSEVQLVRKEGMQVVINDQTEWPDWKEFNATERSVDFWKVIGAVFGDEPGVNFDLYNEPRLYYGNPPRSYDPTAKPPNQAWIWRIWRNGGHAGGTYWVGMQKLVNTVRGLGANNVLWIEGPYFDDTLGMASHYLISGTNLVWSVHHPPLVSDSYWTYYFGYLAQRYPMVDGEWSQYASTRPECHAVAYVKVPQYLSYLRAHDIGLLGWSLQPGVMLTDPKHLSPSNTTVPTDATNPKDLETPSHMLKNYACTTADRGQGTGELLLKYFKDYSDDTYSAPTATVRGRAAS